MKHSKDDILRLSRLMAEKVIQFENRCKNEEHADDAIKCHDLADIAALARLVTADTGDI